MQQTEPIAYLNGRFVPFSEAKLPVYDLGIIQAATVTERLRTVRHQPYLVAEHLERLRDSICAVGFNGMDFDTVQNAVDGVAEENCRLIPQSADLSIVIFVTAGPLLADANGLAGEPQPTLCVHSSPLPLMKWGALYREGVPLVTSSVRQLSSETLSPRIKMRSRLHWYLAEREARLTDPRAMAVLLDDAGFLTETSSGNLFLVQSGELSTPSEQTTLGGISQQLILELAHAEDRPCRRANLSREMARAADEIFLTSSTYCILPVTRFDGQPISSGEPGPVTRHLQQAWGERMGLDFVAQAMTAAGSVMS